MIRVTIYDFARLSSNVDKKGRLRACFVAKKGDIGPGEQEAIKKAQHMVLLTEEEYELLLGKLILKDEADGQLSS